MAVHRTSASLHVTKKSHMKHWALLSIRYVCTCAVLYFSERPHTGSIASTIHHESPSFRLTIVRSIDRAMAARASSQANQASRADLEFPQHESKEELGAHSSETGAENSGIIFTSSSGRRAQHVLSRAECFQIAHWMTARASENTGKIPSKALLEFPQFFRRTPNANVARALRYWRD